MAVFSNEQQKLKDYVASLVIGRHYVITNFKVNPQDQERKLKRVNADYGIVLDIDYPPPKKRDESLKKRDESFQTENQTMNKRVSTPT